MIGEAKRIRSWLSLAWGCKGLVLDVGSGNSPHPRADVLCDRYPADTGHRHGAELVRDRLLVCGDICSLPFGTQAFDFVISRHVLEHLEPGRIPAAVAELTRVAKAGYVEMPSPVCEMLMPDPCHQTFVELRDGVLVFTPKGPEVPFQPIARLFLEWAKTNQAWQRFMRENPTLWTTACHWRGDISFRIEPARPYPASCETTTAELSSICGSLRRGTQGEWPLRQLVKFWLRWVFAAAKVLGQPLARSQQESR